MDVVVHTKFFWAIVAYPHGAFTPWYFTGEVDPKDGSPHFTSDWNQALQFIERHDAEFGLEMLFDADGAYRIEEHGIG